ncbi:MAG: ChaN family lipoprotein, partial [Magnetococcales bacterium]|nr:ChaN family lipoprotein [Magnetococcales bacterium]
MRPMHLALVLTLLAGCASVPDKTPLSEVILEGKSGKTLQRSQVYQEMSQARVIHLGEKHDNLHHHRLQVEILQHLIDSGMRPAIGFETFSRDQTGLLMNYTQGNVSPFKPVAEEKQEEYLRRQLGWVHRNEWELYAPVLRLAKKYRLPTFGADLPTGIKVRMTRAGKAEMFGFELKDLFDTDFKMDAYRKLMVEKLSASHCHTAKEDLLERLYQTWLARNDAMAHSVVTVGDSLPEQPVVLILGLGHVEHDMGVMERVHHRKPQWKQVNVGMGEMDGEHHPTLPPAVEMDGHTFAPSHQFYWLTPANQEREVDDFCSHLPHGTTTPN